jgi:hypothetical protein
MNNIKEHMEVIGADGVHVGTVDRVERRKELTLSLRGAKRRSNPVFLRSLDCFAEPGGASTRSLAMTVQSRPNVRAAFCRLRLLFSLALAQQVLREIPECGPRQRGERQRARDVDRG